MLLLTGLVILVGLLGFGLVAWLMNSTLKAQYEHRALAVARAVAISPGLGDEVAADDQHAVQATALRAQHATHALFVVVTNRVGIRLAHPNPAEIGKEVSTSPTEALHGHDVANIQRGTLGLSARGKVPLRDSSGRIVGEVSVGFDATAITHATWSLVRRAALFLGLTVALGVGGAFLLTHLLRKRTLGLEPADLAELVREREAVLHGISDGVVGIDGSGVITMVNDEAQRLLDARLPIGTKLADAELAEPIRRALVCTSGDAILATCGGHILVVRHRNVTHDDRPLGSVITVFDRTEVENLAGELEAVRMMTNALRVQRHEFANRLHTVHGLLQTADAAQAGEYVRVLLDAPQLSVGDDTAAIACSTLRGFLAAKIADASRREVTLTVSDASWVPLELVAPADVVTVLGNLINNAVEAAATGTPVPRRVEIDLLADGRDLVIAVANTGDGIPPDLLPSLFAPGVSTHGEERGLGLAIAASIVAGLGGTIEVTNPGGIGSMTVLSCRMPYALDLGQSDELVPTTGPGTDEE
jgi:two-component system CitB family sensor kinase